MNGSLFLGAFDPETSLQQASQIQVVRFQKWGHPVSVRGKCRVLGEEQLPEARNQDKHR